jgi:hypothetical protein
LKEKHKEGMTGSGGRRRKQLLDKLKEKRGYWNFKEEALDRTACRTRFRRGFGMNKYAWDVYCSFLCIILYIFVRILTARACKIIIVF